jgi:uncharacterized membrane protein YkvA (DUF1232 family)
VQIAARAVMLARLKGWALAIRRDLHAAYLAARDPRVPWYAKAAAICVTAYALSPIDLIPDFIPVLGCLDDLLIVPLGILLVIWLVPPQLMAEHRFAASTLAAPTRSMAAAAIIGAIWIAAMLVVGWLAYRWM